MEIFSINCVSLFAVKDFSSNFIRGCKQLIRSRLTFIGRYQNTHIPSQKRPIENRCNLFDCEKISFRCFAEYQMGLSDCKGDVRHAFHDQTQQKRTRYFHCCRNSFALTNYTAKESCSIKFLTDIFGRIIDEMKQKFL